MGFDYSTAVAILVLSFCIFMFLRVPIAFCLALSSILTGAYCHVQLAILAQAMVRSVNSFSLLAIPFFILAGELMNDGGISMRLIRLASAIVGKYRGGLAMVNVLASMFFGGISGSSVADASSLGSVLIPMMVKKGYDPDFSVAVTVSGSLQGIIIPPSHNMILYAVAAGGVSMGAFFMSGVIPGLLLGFTLMITAYIIARRRGYPAGERSTWTEKWNALKGASLGLLTVLIVVVGVVSGLYTATEAAAVAALWAFIVTFFIYREIPLRNFGPILLRTLKTLAIVMALIAASGAFGWILAYLKIPTLLTEALLTISENPIIIMLIINLLLLVLGGPMDMAPMIIICTPILLPVVTDPAIGMDPIHFGIIMLLNAAIGLLTPPVGTTLFVGCAIGGITMGQITKALMPFYFVMCALLMLFTYVPWLCMWLPRVLLGYGV